MYYDGKRDAQQGEVQELVCDIKPTRKEECWVSIQRSRPDSSTGDPYSALAFEFVDLHCQTKLNALLFDALGLHRSLPRRGTEYLSSAPKITVQAAQCSQPYSD